MRSRLIRQHQPRRLAGLRLGTWGSIALTISFFALPLTGSYIARQYEKGPERIGQSPVVHAQVYKPFESPELAPVSEQERNIAIIRKVWRRDAAIGIAIARCESGLRAEAFNGRNTNGTWDAGLFQVNTIHGIAKETLFEPYANAGFAYALYTEQGTTPWNSSKHCWGGEL